MSRTKEGDAQPGRRKGPDTFFHPDSHGRTVEVLNDEGEVAGWGLVRNAAGVVAPALDTRARRVLSAAEWDALCASIGADPKTGLPLLKGGGAA